MPSMQQLLWLVLWAILSLNSLLINRVQVYYNGFEVPFFLAVLAAALVAVVARAFTYLYSTPSPDKWDWVLLSLLGAIMGGYGALGIASLQLLPVPMAVLIQAVSPAASYWLAVLLLQEELQWAQGLKALLVFCSITSALLYHRSSLSFNGLVLQATAVFLDVLWQRLHLRAFNNSPSSDARKPVSPLMLLADSAPAAVLVLLVPMGIHDIHRWEIQQYRFRHSLLLAAVACMVLCGLMFLQVQRPVVSGLTCQPTGPLVRAVRDVFVAFAAAKLLNEHLAALQWLLYAIAQVAGIALLSDSSSSSSSQCNEWDAAQGKLLPMVG